MLEVLIVQLDLFPLFQYPVTLFVFPVNLLEQGNSLGVIPCIKTAEDLDNIEAYGITKVRLGNNVKYIEEEWTNNPLGKFLTKCRKKIAERLQSSTEKKKDKKSIYDGF